MFSRLLEHLQGWPRILFHNFLKGLRDFLFWALLPERLGLLLAGMLLALLPGML